MVSKIQVVPFGSNPTSIYIGEHDPLILKSKIKNRRYMVVTSPSHMKNGNVELILSSIDRKPEAIIENVPSNPSLNFLESEIRKLVNLNVEVVIAIGGGSCIDSAKVFARCLQYGNKNSLSSMLGNVQTYETQCSIPLIAIPTTAGTGSEVTPFATIWDNENRRKLSLTGNDLHPESALIFPSLCLSAPPKVLLASALDAVSHAMDALWNKNANEFTNANAVKALNLISITLSVCDFAHLKSKEIENLSLGSLYAGLAISECRTSLSHSISYPLTYTFGLPHGVACAFTLPAIAEYVQKNNILSRELTLNNEASNLLFNSYKYFNQIFSKHGVRELFSEFVPSKSEVLALTPEMHHPDRAVNFPIQITSGEMIYIIEKSLDIIYK